jgi:Flp pilus assembly protein TadG
MSLFRPGARSESGAAVVETALCLCFIVLPLTFGTIGYAYMLSFRQTVSQSAAEGARAAAVAPASGDRVAAARNAVSQSMATGVGGMSCNSAGKLVKAGVAVADSVCSASVANCTSTAGQCVTVTVAYPYRRKSLLPSIPGLGFTLPSTISYSAVAEVS